MPEEDIRMRGYTLEQSLARMAASLPTPAEGILPRHALEGGRTLFTWLLGVWRQLEAEDALAYEDKLATQVRLLEEAIPNLAQLYRTLRHTRRQLKRQLRTL
jgi:hypothetical protein